MDVTIKNVVNEKLQNKNSTALCRASVDNYLSVIGCCTFEAGIYTKRKVPRRNLSIADFSVQASALDLEFPRISVRDCYIAGDQTQTDRPAGAEPPALLVF
ncbi:MAG: hypothetical protein K9J42_02145 [Sulfuritalea sp.]|nr:hypothetical protein [Sulfuritalea sp.]